MTEYKDEKRPDTRFNLGVSFEVLHLLFGVSNRLEQAFAKSGLKPEDAYLLAYINDRGGSSKSNQSNRDVRVVPQARTLEILESAIGCPDGRGRAAFNRLATSGFLALKKLTPAEKDALNITGTTQAYYLTLKGQEKLIDVVHRMMELREELLSPVPRILVPPGDNKVGLVGNGIQFFLRMITSPGRLAAFLTRTARVAQRADRYVQRLRSKPHHEVVPERGLDPTGDERV